MVEVGNVWKGNVGESVIRLLYFFGGEIGLIGLVFVAVFEVAFVANNNLWYTEILGRM